jgi:hypothetical protein
MLPGTVSGARGCVTFQFAMHRPARGNKPHLATARTLYREMDMQFWLEQAQTETALG